MTGLRSISRHGLICAVLAGFAWPAGAAHRAHLDRAVTQALANGSGPQRVIVRTTSNGHAAVRARLEARGKHVRTVHPGIHALTVTVDASDLNVLALDPSVESISLDADLTSDGNSKTSGSTSGSTSTTGSTYTSTTLLPDSLRQALALGDYVLGSQVGVAVIDSGLADNGDFTGRIAGFYDFTTSTNGTPVASAPYDDYGHGTHVAGLVGSSGAISSGAYAGVAQTVRFFVLKVLDRNGKGRSSDLINAIEFVIANKNALNIQVINLSLGHPIYEPAATDPLVLEVERATAAGLIVVAAAGNCGVNPATGLPGYAGLTSPGNAPSAITVGAANTFATAIRSDDRVADYSSRGPTWYDGFAKPDVVAPGHALVSDEAVGSSLPLTYPWLVVTSGSRQYLKLSGTSMATAVVSGLVAVMLDVNRYGAIQRATQTYGGKYVKSGAWTAPPYPTANAVKAMLQYSATQLRDARGVVYDALTQGAGEVNGEGALYLAYFADTSQPAGAQWMTYPITPSTVFGGTETVAWNQSIIWGTNVATGSALINVNQATWAWNVIWGQGDNDNLVWGSSDGDNIVWGNSIYPSDNIVWSSNIVWANDVVWGNAYDWETNIVWGNCLIGYFDGQNIIWSSMFGDNIVWGSLADDNLVWGSTSNRVYSLYTVPGSF